MGEDAAIRIRTDVVRSVSMVMVMDVESHEDQGVDSNDFKGDGGIMCRTLTNDANDSS